MLAGARGLPREGLPHDRSAMSTTIADEASARAFVAERCDAEAMERLERLIAALAQENAKQNLVSAASLDAVWQRHIADSAQLLDHVPAGLIPHNVPRGTSQPWLDLGSGAGFPGLVIAAMRPDWPMVLVESRKRRTEWLNAICEELGLVQCRIAAQRLELVESFAASVISARAFAPLPKLIKLSARFSTQLPTGSTLWLLPKGRKAAQELGELPQKQRKMFHVEQSATSKEAGILVGFAHIKA